MLKLTLYDMLNSEACYVDAAQIVAVYSNHERARNYSTIVLANGCGTLNVLESTEEIIKLVSEASKH